MFLEKPNVPYGMTKDFTIEQSLRAVSRYFDERVVNFDPSIHEKAFQFVVKQFGPYMRDSVVLGVDEAIAATAGDTSSGYPEKFRGHVLKRDFFASEDCNAKLDADWEDCLNGDYAERVIYDVLDKEEIRPIEKIQSGSIRSIACPPVTHMITGQRLFCDMNSKMYQAHLHTASCVGLSKTQGNFSRAIKKLGVHARGFAGDETAWDASLAAVLMNVACEFRVLMMPSEEVRIRNYYKALIETIFRMPNGWLLRKLRGNPSGSCNTSADNTIILYFLLAYCWLKYCSDSYEEFERSVSKLLYGDDNTFTVDEDYIRVYNLETLASAMRDYGVVLKNPHDPPIHYSKLNFLSCTWIFKRSAWLPVMEPEKLMMSMHYSEYPADPVMQALIVIEYIVTNPFADGFYDYCVRQIEVLYKHMSTDDMLWIKRHIPSMEDMYQLYTGNETSSPACKRHDYIRGPKRVFRRERNFQNVPLFKIVEVFNHSMSESSNTPIHGVSGGYTQRQVSIGQQVLNSAVLTDDARRWLVRAVDPFYDHQLKPAGFPDMGTVASVVQEINLSTTISAPSTVTAGSNWDCHIFNMAHFAVGSTNSVVTTVVPAFWNPMTGELSGYSGGGMATTSGGLSILSGPTQSALLPGGTPTAPLNVGAESSVVLNPAAQGLVSSKCRVVGMAFEVVNTTADISLQGLVTVYRMPQCNQVAMVDVFPAALGAGGNVAMPARMVALPPLNAAQALTLPGSKQWDAKDGSYCVCTLMGEENPIQGFDNMPVMYVDEGFWPGSNAPATAVLHDVSSISATSTYNYHPKYYAPYNTSGAYYTGLSYATTLQVNMKILLESIPGPRDAFATLAQPGPEYSPEAIKLYGQIVDRMPVGVPFTENPSGEWFSDVLGTVGDLAMTASGINPIFGLVGRGFGIGKMLYDAISKSQEARRQQVVHDGVPKRDKAKKVLPTPPVQKKNRNMVVQAAKTGLVLQKPKIRTVTNVKVRKA